MSRWAMVAAVIIGQLVPSRAIAAEPAVTAPDKSCISISAERSASEMRCLKPGSGRTDWFKDCSVCPEMVVVPQGALPVRTVDRKATLGFFPKPFSVGRFAVTFDEWDACVDDGGCNGYRPADEGWGRADRPVVNVNWDDAIAYTRWLSQKTDQPYRLLSDAEREYVTRAGTTTVYWWGDAIDLDRANYDVPKPSRRMPGVDYGEIAKVRHQTVPVGAFAANPWGLYNVHGNIWEWTRDCWLEEGATAVPDKACGERVARGGSWNDFADSASASSRIGFNATARNPLQGFRVARNLP